MKNNTKDEVCAWPARSGCVAGEGGIASGKRDGQFVPLAQAKKMAQKTALSVLTGIDDIANMRPLSDNCVIAGV